MKALDMKQVGKKMESTGTLAEFRSIVGSMLPKGYPMTEEDWRVDITGMMEVALWKGCKRLAEEMDEVDLKLLGGMVGTLGDRLMVHKGQPTSIQQVQVVKVNHKEMMESIRKAKVVVDV